MSCGTKMRTQKRKNNMYLFGSTMGAADKAPKFILSLLPNKKHSMLPRPIVTSKPKQKGFTMMKEKWLMELVNDVSNISIDHLKKFSYKNHRNTEILNLIHYAVKKVPSCLRICNTVFTQMALIGDPIDQNNTNSSSIPNHIDPDDVINCIITFGEINSGGSTNYYDGLEVGTNISKKLNGKLIFSVPFIHGQLQLGQYKDIIHGVDQ